MVRLEKDGSVGTKRSRSSLDYKAPKQKDDKATPLIVEQQQSPRSLAELQGLSQDEIMKILSDDPELAQLAAAHAQEYHENQQHTTPPTSSTRPDSPGTPPSGPPTRSPRTPPPPPSIPYLQWGLLLLLIVGGLYSTLRPRRRKTKKRFIGSVSNEQAVVEELANSVLRPEQPAARSNKKVRKRKVTKARPIAFVPETSTRAVRVAPAAARASAPVVHEDDTGTNDEEWTQVPVKSNKAASRSLSPLPSLVPTSAATTNVANSTPLSNSPDSTEPSSDPSDPTPTSNSAISEPAADGVAVLASSIENGVKNGNGKKPRKNKKKKKTAGTESSTPPLHQPGSIDDDEALAARLQQQEDRSAAAELQKLEQHPNDGWEEVVVNRKKKKAPATEE